MILILCFIFENPGGGIEITFLPNSYGFPQKEKKRQYCFVVVVLVVGAYQHCSHEGLLYFNHPMEFRHSSLEALHTKRRERDLC
jgi:hypothetical protein